MRHRIKKIPSLSKQSHLLHSDNGTYTALRFGPLNAISKKSLPATASVRKRKGLFSSLTLLVLGGRKLSDSSEKGSSQSDTYFYNNKFGNRLGCSYSILKTIPLVLGSLSLLLVFSMMIFPRMPEAVFAVEGDDVSEVDTQSDLQPALSLTMPDYKEGEVINLQKEVDKETSTGYLSIDFNVVATNIDKYDVYVQSSNSALTGHSSGTKVESIISDTTYSEMQKATGWGYAVAKDTQDPTTLTYKPIQTTVNTSADTGNATNTTITQPYTLAFAANLAGATPDHYESNITLSVAAGATQVATLYSITYSTNNSTAGTTPPIQSAMSDSTSYGFTAPTAEQYGLAKDSYTFMGWAESPNAVFEDYKANTTINLSSTSPTKTLYAIWGKNYTYKYSLGEGKGTVPANGTIMLGNLPYTMTPSGSRDNIYRMGYLATGWSSITFTTENPSPTATPTWTASTASNFNVMQEINKSGYCAALNTTGRQLFDNRDGKKYWVAKLGDGNCWMTQNLDYDDPNSTRVTDTSGTNGGPASGKWSTDNTARQYWDPGEKIVSGSTLINASSSTDRHQLVGNYYSWLSATNGTNTTTNNTDASGSICPDGWKLPLSGTLNNNNTISNNATSGSFGKLLSYHSVTTNSDANLIKTPLYFVRGGYVGNGSLSDAGSNGRYWSSTASGTGSAYNLLFSSTSVLPSSSNHRHLGFSLRCVAR